MELMYLPNYLLQNIGVAWTFFLLVARFTGVLMALPGLSAGIAGLAVRIPAILVFAFAALISSPKVALPESAINVAIMLIGELMFGSLIGLLPLLVISGIQTAAGIASTTMGLQASQLIDPTLQTSVADLSRIYGDMTILVFLSLGGHYFVFYAASGLAGVLEPGTFLMSGKAIEIFVNHSADIFHIGVLFSAPVLVALLVTNVVLGLISRAIPSVNVFIISFPLTIGVGLFLSIFLFSELVPFITPWVTRLDPAIREIIDSSIQAPGQ
jgi:flagellar biosynthetic protein FliR